MEWTLIQLGVLSMFIWFLHGIFFTGGHFLQPFIYSVKEPILIYLLCMAIVVPAAYVLNAVHTRVWRKIKN